MGIKTAGALKPLQYIEESTFGTLPSGAFSYGGKLSSQSQSNTYDIETFVSDGSRTTELVNFAAQEVGFDVELGTYLDDGAYSWTYLLDLALGSSSARSDIPSFSALFEAAPDQYYLYRGCKVDSLTLTASGVGKAVIASVGAKAMIGKAGSTKAELCSNADATIPALNPVTHNCYPTITLGSDITVPAMSWSIAIANGLTLKEGIVDGKPLKAGSLIYPDGMLDITLEYTVASTSLVWDRLKMLADEQSRFTVTHKVGEYTLTFSSCWFSADDLPTRGQSGYDETVTIKASDVTWSKT